MDNTPNTPSKTDTLFEAEDYLFMQKVHDKLELTRYKNAYGNICELLEEPYYSKSKSKYQDAEKKKQMRYWQRFFTWRTDGRAWIITEIFNSPKAPSKPGPKRKHLIKNNK